MISAKRAFNHNMCDVSYIVFLAKSKFWQILVNLLMNDITVGRAKDL